MDAAFRRPSGEFVCGEFVWRRTMTEHERLREHSVHLARPPVHLRPLTEDDWELLLRWNSDAEVLFYSEGDDVQSRDLEDIQGIYRGVSQAALCFVMEHNGRPVGECWLQRMNLPWIQEAFLAQDLRRIDIAIGEKDVWGQGIGTTAIDLLCGLAFESEGADAVFACSVADYNPRSRRAFERNGFTLWREVPEPPGQKAVTSYYLLLTRERYAVGGSGDAAHTVS
jgi:RimJ/RimL family protein N-acetyltransferase